MTLLEHRPAGAIAGVAVRLRGDHPEQFLRDGRLYLVQDVLAHELVPGSWEPAADGPHERWRVLAGPGRAAGTAVYDLCLDIARDHWTVTAVEGGKRSD